MSRVCRTATFGKSQWLYRVDLRQTLIDGRHVPSPVQHSPGFGQKRALDTSIRIAEFANHPSLRD
jgi:hypothetical protein